MRKVKDNIMYVFIYLSTFITIGILVFILGFIFYNGIGKINLDFFKNEYNSKTMYVTVEKQNISGSNEENYINTLGVNVDKDKDGNYYITDIDKNSPVKDAIARNGKLSPITKGSVIKQMNKQNISEKDINEINELSAKSEDILIKVTYPSGGVFPMIVTTFMVIVLSLLLAVPIGIFSAIYLVEYAKQGRIVKIIRFAVECLSGIPSIIYGLFGMLFFVSLLGFNYSILSGALTISIILLPIIIRTTEESLKTVPDSYREGSFGVGATKLQTIWKIIVPSAMPGILTAVILSIGRIVGESAALLLTAGTVAKIPNSIFSSGSTLTVKAYTVAKEEGNIQMACAIGLVVVLMIIVLNIASKLITKFFNKSKA